MKNRKHYIAIENPIKTSNYMWNKYIIIPEGQEVIEGKYYRGCETLEEAENEAKDYNSEYYTSDYSLDELEEWFNSIDFKPLEDAINEHLNTNLTFTKKFENSRNGYVVRFKANEDLCKLPNAGLLANVFKSCELKEFNTSLYADKQTGELRIWMTIDFSYKHFDSGSNGCELVSVNYSDKEGWKMLFESDRKRDY